MSAFGGWLRRNWGVVAVLAVTAIGMAGTYISTHQLFPDTQYYLAWTYRLMGVENAESERIVIEYIRSDGVFAPYEYLWGSPLELSTKPRILLPLLSIPLVKVFGPAGITIIPGIALLLAMYVIYRFASLHASTGAAVLASCLPLMSTAVLNWSVGALTDSMSLLFHALALYLLPWRKAATWKTAALVGMFCALAATARMIAPFSIAIAVLWFWGWKRSDDRRSWTIAAAGAVLGTIAGTVWTKVLSAGLTAEMYYYIMTNGQIDGLRDLPRWYLSVGTGFLVDEFGFILASPPLAVLLILSFAACWTARRTVVPWLVLSAWLGMAGLFLINPAPTAFRYELPMLPALVVAVAVLFDQVFWRRRELTPEAAAVVPAPRSGATDSSVAVRIPSPRAASRLEDEPSYDSSLENR